MLSHELPDQRGHFITREEASSIALAAAKEAVRETLTETFAMLGVNLANFDSMQAFRDDIEWARRGRKISELTGRRIWTTLVAIGASAVAIGLWETIKNLLGKH